MQPTITGELRKWRRKTGNGGNVVTGIMYNDRNGIYHDGEPAVIMYLRWEETPTFYLAVTKFTAVKCPKDEEIVDDPKPSLKGK